MSESTLPKKLKVDTTKEVAPRENKSILYARVKPVSFDIFHAAAMKAGMRIGEFMDRVAESLKD